VEDRSEIGEVWSVLFSSVWKLDDVSSSRTSCIVSELVNGNQLPSVNSSGGEGREAKALGFGRPCIELSKLTARCEALFWRKSGVMMGDGKDVGGVGKLL